MDGGRRRAWQPRGGGRWSLRPGPFNHPHTQTPQPPTPAVGDELSGSGSGSNSRSIKDGRKTWQRKSGSGSGGTFSHYKKEHNSPVADAALATPSPSIPPSSDCAMLISDVPNKLNICETQIPLMPGSGHSESNNPKTTTSSAHHPTQTEQQQQQLDPFDICPPKQTKTATVVLKPSLLVTNRERRNEIKRSNNMDANKARELRPGMVLFKAYISLADQVKIVKRCRELGMGCGGFYQPGYREGTKLHLKMMCLGKNWDPQTGQYGDHRPSDGAKPPDIPAEFHHLIENALRDSHALIQQHSETTTNPHDILPCMSSNICIVNFYSQNGRLGLHQDKDESEESLRQGLPVVSFSIGDSADFLYGDERDVDKAHKVVLESGDVLIFGGSSRNVFHGVTAIHPMTAPKVLLEETNLRPGRLNLTFRQY